MSKRVVDLHEMSAVDPVPMAVPWWATIRLAHLLIRGVRGVRVKLEGFPESLDEPVIFAMNHTHRYDFLPSKVALDLQHKRVTATVIKYRAFQNPAESLFMRKYGNVPITSRGYLISADFKCVHSRKPTESEYRALREHVDAGEALPDEPALQTLLTQPRDMLGLPFDPAERTYRQMIGACYRHAMNATLDLCRTVLDAGNDLHLYPEGQFSSRLAPGRIGTVEFAVALDVPIVPVGFSGMNALYERDKLLPARSGTLTMRIGEPYRVKRRELEGFRAFDPDHELRFRAVLEEETAMLMDRINDLLEPDCARSDEASRDGLEGVDRFIE